MKNIQDIRSDFPYLAQGEKPLVYLDNAATTQKPRQVIEAMKTFYEQEYATVHRGIYSLSEKATVRFEGVREKVATFIGGSSSEIIFTSGATEGINIVANTWGEDNIGPNDRILVSEMEHHSNLAPWQELARRKCAEICYIPVTQKGTLNLEAYNELLTPNTKLVAITQESNVLGTLNPIEKMVALAQKVGAVVLVDAAQSIPHQPINVRDMDADFVVFSGHKMLGPSGVGVLYMKESILNFVSPHQFGGGMVYESSLEKTTYVSGPQKLEAGTPPIAEIIGLGAAIDYLSDIDFEKLKKHEAELTKVFIEGISKIPEVTIYGPIEELKQSGHLVSIALDGYHPHDIAAFLDRHNIAVRAGDFCAQPLVKRLNARSLLRISFYLYNTLDEVHYLLDVLSSLCKN